VPRRRIDQTPDVRKFPTEDPYNFPVHHVRMPNEKRSRHFCAPGTRVAAAV
jgi:hypothetical protein